MFFFITETVFQKPGKVGKRPESVKLLSQQFFLESWEKFSKCQKNISQKSFWKVGKILGKVS